MVNDVWERTAEKESRKYSPGHFNNIKPNLFSRVFYYQFLLSASNCCTINKPTLRTQQNMLHVVLLSGETVEGVSVDCT